MIAIKYGLPLDTILPLQAHSRKYVAGATQKRGGNGEGDFVIVHTNEATHTRCHYSCMPCRSTPGEDFDGVSSCSTGGGEEGRRNAGEVEARQAEGQATR